MELKVGMKARIGINGYVTLTSLSSEQGSLLYHWLERADLHGSTIAFDTHRIRDYFRDFLIVPKWEVAFNYNKYRKLA